MSAASGPGIEGTLGSHQHLYAVYCNGTIDHLDMQLQAKIASFQLSARSGSPAAIAALPSPGVRPDSCLARPVTTIDPDEQTSAGVVHIVGTDRLTRNDTDGHKPYSLLTFAVPGWTLQARRDLGSFDVLNGTPPRITRGTGRALEVLDASNDDTADIVAEARQFAGGAPLNSPRVIARSVGVVLVEYASAGTTSAAVALIDRVRRSMVRIEGLPGEDPEPALLLAPGGKYVLHAVRRLVQVPGGQKIAATGELRVYGADGKLVKELTDERVAGDWHAITISPQGVALFTDRRGNYRFVPLALTFGTDPVADPNTDDLDGTRPGVIYAGG